MCELYGVHCIYILCSGDHPLLLPCSFRGDWVPSLITEKHSKVMSLNSEDRITPQRRKERKGKMQDSENSSQKAEGKQKMPKMN